MFPYINIKFRFFSWFFFVDISKRFHTKSTITYYLFIHFII